ARRRAQPIGRRREEWRGLLPTAPPPTAEPPATHHLAAPFPPGGFPWPPAPGAALRPGGGGHPGIAAESEPAGGGQQRPFVWLRGRYYIRINTEDKREGKPISQMCWQSS